jgi:hypothetical protein
VERCARCLDWLCSSHEVEDYDSVRGKAAKYVSEQHRQETREKRWDLVDEYMDAWAAKNIGATLDQLTPEVEVVDRLHEKWEAMFLTGLKHNPLAHEDDGEPAWVDSADQPKTPGRARRWLSYEDELAQYTETAIEALLKDMKEGQKEDPDIVAACKHMRNKLKWLPLVPIFGVKWGQNPVPTQMYVLWVMGQFLNARPLFNALATRVDPAAHLTGPVHWDLHLAPSVDQFVEIVLGERLGLGPVPMLTFWTKVSVR